MAAYCRFMPIGGGSNLKIGVAHGEHRTRAYKGFWGGAPSEVQGQSPWSGGRSSPEAERFFRHYTSEGQAIFASLPNF